jgi:hypothetical protein
MSCKGAVQEDDEEIDAVSEADDTVVAIVTVPLTVALAPDAVAEPLKLAIPTPPEIASSCSSVSSIKNSIMFLLTR